MNFHVNTSLDGRTLNVEAVRTHVEGEHRRSQLEAEQRRDNELLCEMNSEEHRRMVEDGFDTTDRIAPLQPFRWLYVYTVTACQNGPRCIACKAARLIP